MAAFLIEAYTPERLKDIVTFFKTRTGQEMLQIAEDNELFKRISYQSPRKGPVAQWKPYLSLQQFTAYKSFSATDSGRFFVEETYRIRRSLRYVIWERAGWPEPPLNTPYIIELLNVDGIFEFANPAARAGLIRNLRANLD